MMNVFGERSTIKDECATDMVLGIAKLTYKDYRAQGHKTYKDGVEKLEVSQSK